MGKLIILGIAVFFTVGIVMEHIVDKVFSPEAEAAFNRTANQFLAAQQEGEAIPADPEMQAEQRPAVMNRQLELSDCSAANIHPFNQPQAAMSGTVTQVVDGDTLKAAVDGIEMKIRLWGIDAPEMDQRHGEESRQGLQTMAPRGSRITIHPLSMDHYGRVVGNIGEDSEPSVNFVMVARGWAYHYQEFSAKHNRCFLEAERLARDSRAGIWRDGEAGGERPWNHRQQERQQQQEADRTST